MSGGSLEIMVIFSGHLGRRRGFLNHQCLWLEPLKYGELNILSAQERDYAPKRILSPLGILPRDAAASLDLLPHRSGEFIKNFRLGL